MSAPISFQAPSQPHRRIEAGERDVNRDRLAAMGVLEASWSVEIEAPRDRCYAIAADVERAPGWQGTLEEVDVITRDEEGRAELVHTVSDATVRKVSSELRFSYDPPGSIRWEQEKGEVKWLEG